MSESRFVELLTERLRFRDDVVDDVIDLSIVRVISLVVIAMVRTSVLNWPVQSPAVSRHIIGAHRDDFRVFRNDDCSNLACELTRPKRGCVCEEHGVLV